jgi:hypothetical protein
VFLSLVAWAFALLGLVMAVVCALNCLGLARGRLWIGGERMGILGLGMVSAGIAGFCWDIPLNDDPTGLTWRDYLLLLAGSGGLVLMAGSEVRRSGEAAAFRRWVRQGARIYTIRSEWRRKHFVVLGAVAASGYAMGFVPEDRWFYWVAILLFMALVERLKILPIHFGRRPPPVAPATKP